MFINISAKKLGSKYSKAMAKNYNMSESDFLEYHDLHETKEKGVYISYSMIKTNLDTLKYEIVHNFFYDLVFNMSLPKSILKREKRKLRNRGITHLKDCDLFLNSYKDLVERTNRISEIEKKHILKNIRKYSTMSGYGIADNEFQVKKHFDFLEKSKNKYVVIMSPVWRENQSEKNGFRYHKNGAYIGKQNLKHEYLFDDTHVEKVFLFEIFEIKEKEKINFGKHNYKNVNNYIYNKKEEVVAIFAERNREIICGYQQGNESIFVPESVNIENESEFYDFLDKNEDFLG